MQGLLDLPGVLGVDVSKSSLSCALLCPQSRHLLWERDFPNTQSGVDDLLARLPDGIPVVVEPTGRLSELVVQRARASQRPVLLAPPKRARSFLAGVQSRAKTDRLDGRGLALFALSVSLRPFPLKSAAVEQVTQLLSARKGISESIARLSQQRAQLPHAAQALDAAISSLRKQITALDERIVAASAQEQDLAATRRRLLAIPGVGPVTAAALAARLCSRQFATSDAFVAFCGLDVTVRDSGQSRGRRTLSHQGDAELRRLLYLCAQSSLRVKSSPFKAQYERELAKGLPTTAALCALARKLAKLCWSLHKHSDQFASARVYQQGSQPESQKAQKGSKQPASRSPESITS